MRRSPRSSASAGASSSRLRRTAVRVARPAPIPCRLPPRPDRRVRIAATRRPVSPTVCSMALSMSRPDPSSPDAVAAATFSTGRRGFDQGEVRDFLRMVAAELARLQERERYLERELRTAQRAAPNPAIALDEEVVTRLLGEEASRILATSREAASQIKVRAEETAARIVGDAADEGQRVREEAQVEAARRRQDAAADAESE